MRRSLAVISIMAALLSGCAAEEPEPCTKGSVTVIMDGGEDLCYVGEVDIINDGQDGKAVRIDIRAWKGYVMDDEF